MLWSKMRGCGCLAAQLALCPSFPDSTGQLFSKKMEWSHESWQEKSVSFPRWSLTVKCAVGHDAYVDVDACVDSDAHAFSPEGPENGE